MKKRSLAEILPTNLASIFPNEASSVRLISASLSEISDDWESRKIHLVINLSIHSALSPTSPPLFFQKNSSTARLAKPRGLPYRPTP